MGDSSVTFPVSIACPQNIIDPHDGACVIKYRGVVGTEVITNGGIERLHDGTDLHRF